MSTTLQYDSEASRLIEATYTTPDVVEQRRVVRQALALRPGERVIDVGTGPALLAAEMAAEVGPGGLVCGIDVSEPMLALARRRATRPESAPIQLRHAGAEQLPYAAASFDVAVSTQVLEYAGDVPGTLAEVHRVLRPGGRALVLDTDWDSIVWRSSDDQRMERVLVAWEEHLVDPHLPRTLKGSLERVGFQVAPPQVVPLLNVGFDQATYSAGLLEKAFHHCRGGTCWQASASWRAEEDCRAAAEVSIQGGTSSWPWAWYSRAWIRHSSLSASLASRASGLWRASYSSTSSRIA